jgi:hypothetical protein
MVEVEWLSDRGLRIIYHDHWTHHLVRDSEDEESAVGYLERATSKHAELASTTGMRWLLAHRVSGNTDHELVQLLWLCEQYLPSFRNGYDLPECFGRSSPSRLCHAILQVCQQLPRCHLHGRLRYCRYRRPLHPRHRHSPQGPQGEGEISWHRREEWCRSILSIMRRRRVLNKPGLASVGGMKGCRCRIEMCVYVQGLLFCSVLCPTFTCVLLMHF